MKNKNLQLVKTERPKLLVIGYGRHGKDTVCEMLRDKYGYKFMSSSMFAAQQVVYPVLKNKYGYATVDECYADRHNHRAEWFELIAAYNAFDLSRLARELLVEHDIYCGMRNRAELLACKEQGVFDHIVWVDATGRGIPPEDASSCTVGIQDATYIIYNNGTLNDLDGEVELMHKAFTTN